MITGLIILNLNMMDNEGKQAVIRTYKELFIRGEMLKAQRFINELVPLWLEDDENILEIRKECNNRIEEIKSWRNGRPYPGTHATVEFESFDKFVKARELIRKSFPEGAVVMDIGCYSADFIKGIEKENKFCYGLDLHKELVEKLEKEKTKGAKYRVAFGSAEALPAGDSSIIDVVTAFDVLEHVVDLDKSIEEIDRVCKPGGLVIINLPRMTHNYEDEAFEHMRMFDDEEIERIWGKKNNYKFRFCEDELGRLTSFITYEN